mgnify:FL=1
MFNLKKINSLETKNFYSFNIENFLDADLYEKLEKDFPDFNSLDKDKLIDGGDGKYSINPSVGYYEELIKSSDAFKVFFEEISSKRFFLDIFKIFRFKIIHAKKSSLSDFLKIFKFSKFQFKKLNIFERIFFKRISVNFQISFMINGAHIKPHTDSRSKLCALLLYFPDKKLDKSKKELEEKIGTQFWDSSLKNYENNNYENLSDIFPNKSSRSIKTSFVGKNAYGFIKNDKSWHSVEKINVAENYVRRSININLNYS